MEVHPHRPQVNEDEHRYRRCSVTSTDRWKNDLEPPFWWTAGVQERGYPPPTRAPRVSVALCIQRGYSQRRRRMIGRWLQLG